MKVSGTSGQEEAALENIRERGKRAGEVEATTEERWRCQQTRTRKQERQGNRQRQDKRQRWWQMRGDGVAMCAGRGSCLGDQGVCRERILQENCML
jgi:hypothetical protein